MFEFKGKKYKQPKHPDLNHIASILQRAPTIILDTETTGLDWRTDVTVGFVLNWGPTEDEGCYLPIRHGGSVKGKGRAADGNMDPKKVIAMLREELPREDLRVVGHNLSFDLKFLHNDGIELVRGQKIEDTMINAFLLDERQRSFALDACCQFMGVQDKKGRELYEYICSKFHPDVDISKASETAMRGMMGDYWRLRGDDPVGVDYALGDGASTWQLWEAQQPGLDAPDFAGNTLRPAWDIESRLIRPLHRMMVRGIKIDEDRLDQVRAMVARKLKNEMKKLPKDFSLKGEKKQMAAFFTKHGHTDWPLTPAKGEPSFTADWLKTNPPGKIITRCRTLEDLDSKFLRPMAERHLFKGRVHASFNQTRGEKFGTKTARLSCNDPNLQAAHKRNEEMGSILRSIFAPDKGMLWWDADYNQCEPRLLAHYGQVRVLIEGYLSDPVIDAHSAVANSAGIPRQAGKTLNQALITGAGRGEVISQLAGAGLNRREAIAIMDAYHANMPEIHVFQKRAMAVMSQRGFVRCLMGHRGRSEGSRFDYKAVNKLLQTGNAGITKKAFVDVDEYLESEGDQVHLLNTVHDSFGLQYHPDQHKTLTNVRTIMEDFGPGRAVELTVPMVVDADEGDSWAVATWGLEVVSKVFADYGEKY